MILQGLDLLGMLEAHVTRALLRCHISWMDELISSLSFATVRRASTKLIMTPCIESELYH